MTLPTRVRVPEADPEESTAQLIVFTRHHFPEMASRTATNIRRRGRGYTFKILAALAGPIVMYYREINDRPLSAHGFEPGSAEHFSYGYVGAVLDGRDDLRDEHLETFWGSCESEVERAMLLMAGTASQCLNLITQMQQFDAAISAL